MSHKLWGLNAVRYGIPIALVVLGLVLLFAEQDSRRFDAFAMLVGSGLGVAVLNALYRLSVSSDRERDDELRAREFLSQHGYWPDEAPDHEDRGTHE